jgi:hypothetical protein
VPEGGKYRVFEDGRPIRVDSVEDFEKRLAAKAEYVLRREAFFVNQAVNNDHLQAGLAAQMELDRRTAERQELILKRVTYLAALIGAGATIVGVILGAYLSG